MSEEITFRYLNDDEATRFTTTMYQAVTACGLAVDNTAPLERELCQQFALHQTGDLRPEQLEEALRWMISVWMLDQLEFSLQSVYERANEIMRDIQGVYLLANRQRTLIATQYKFMVAVALMLMMSLQPVLAVPFSLKPLTCPVFDQQSDIIARPFTARTDSDVLERAATPSAEQDTDYGNDPARIFQAIPYASQFSISVWVDRAFLVDCGMGFPQWEQLKDKIYLDAALLTEIPPTNFSPAVYRLAASDTAGDFSKEYTMLYLDSLLGAKMLYGFSPVESRLPNPFHQFGILYQNIYLGAAPLSFQEKRDSNRAPLTWCWGCLASINQAALKVRETDAAAAFATAGTIAVGCAKLIHPGAIALCVGAAATGLGIAIKRNENIRAGKIVNAKLGPCSHDKTKNPPEACPWTK